MYVKRQSIEYKSHIPKQQRNLFGCDYPIFQENTKCCPKTLERLKDFLHQLQRPLETTPPWPATSLIWLVVHFGGISSANWTGAVGLEPLVNTAGVELVATWQDTKLLSRFKVTHAHHTAAGREAKHRHVMAAKSEWNQ